MNRSSECEAQKDYMANFPRLAGVLSWRKYNIEIVKITPKF